MLLSGQTNPCVSSTSLIFLISAEVAHRKALMRGFMAERAAESPHVWPLLATQKAAQDIFNAALEF